MFIAKLTLDTRDGIGEGPIWDSAANRFLWLDTAVGVIHEARVIDGDLTESRRWNLGRRVAAAIPRAAGGLIIACGTEIAMLGEAGEIAPFVRLGVDPTLVRLSSAKCDSQGRFGPEHSPLI